MELEPSKGSKQALVLQITDGGPLLAAWGLSPSMYRDPVRNIDGLLAPRPQSHLPSEVCDVASLGAPIASHVSKRPVSGLPSGF